MSSPDDRLTVRRVAIVIGLVLATLLGLALLWAVRRVLVWILLAAFFAAALKPAVDHLQRRFVRRRTVATLLVFLAAFVLIAAVGALIVVPLVDEVARFVERVPEFVRDTRAGRGRLGELVDRFGLRRYAETHGGQLQEYGDRLRQPALGLVRGVLEAVVGAITVGVLAYLMVLESPRMGAALLALTGDRVGDRWCLVGRECARTVTGYVTGNLVISLVCGSLTFVVLAALGVPFAAVIALVVAVADLVPLVGATIGALVAAGAAFVHSPTAGIVTVVFFVLYQQVENHLLQPVVMSRAVRLNPLTVLVSVLLAAELAGLVGALLAIPAAGILQVLLRAADLPRLLHRGR
ncbi:AI-2E family transporter [Micromonospora sagamiensis]|uniref:Putative PurR-regulated permease PerM n=1 Tax=Micromonospora sagamiensis TaxID=47875 RepID=A0A562WIB2_9ACTN|nr:AI-2E family transporter [Micromonospora sagamiensis]TWJ29888.1 putative PurR-regulated permease PerM [Micromonospora sagamiensis]BCL17083.1 AI-2E family transporter [Micromonospora sagamiensis]